MTEARARARGVLEFGEFVGLEARDAGRELEEVRLGLFGQALGQARPPKHLRRLGQTLPAVAAVHHVHAPRGVEQHGHVGLDLARALEDHRRLNEQIDDQGQRGQPQRDDCH